MKPTLKLGLFAAPLAALVVALATLFWAPGSSGAIQSTLSGLSWRDHHSQLLNAEPARLARDDKMVELEVKDVIPIEEANTHAVVLVTKDHKYLLPIFVTEEGAVSIAFRLAQRPSPHPLAADLLDDVVNQMGGKVTEVRIDSVQDDIYTSHVVIRQNGKDLSINARPSDAIAMALTGKAKIVCNPQVLSQAGITQQEINQLRKQMGLDGEPGVGGSGKEGQDEPTLPDEGGQQSEPPDITPDGSNIRL